MTAQEARELTKAKDMNESFERQYDSIIIKIEETIRTGLYPVYEMFWKGVIFKEVQDKLKLNGYTFWYTGGDPTGESNIISWK